MADEIDISNDRIEAELSNEQARIRAEAAKFDPGKPGDCELCGEWSRRLVKGVCAPCRDKWGLE